MLVTLGTHRASNIWFSCFIVSVKQRLTSSNIPEAGQDTCSYDCHSGSCHWGT